VTTTPPAGPPAGPSVSDTDRHPDEPGGIRLPKTIRPRRYVLELAPDLEAARFAGQVEIEVDVEEESAFVRLHAVDLEISAATARQAGRSLPCRTEAADEPEEIRLVPTEPLVPGPWTLELHFTGTLNDRLAGFYRSRYTGPTGTAETLAVTQFEATDARRAFPCFDEPEMKASFAVRLVAPADCLAISNAPVERTDPLPDGRLRHVFAETVPMSTYLVAFVVGRLEATEPVVTRGIPIRVVHVPGKGHLTGLALAAARHALEFYEDYFALPYPGRKLDLLAIPDFAFGAMENLGAVTFRETALLADPEDSSQLDRQRIVEVVSHEIAHMWFGDLVTMKWWNGIWLNEAFATFMETLCSDHFEPAWRIWTSFGLGREAALQVDGLPSTRPIEYPVRTPADAEGMFDQLTYEKGGAVLRMLEQYLGAERFRDGIRLYLSRHRFANTETTDLWDALGEATGEPVRELMDGWIFQPGHPLLTLSADGGDLLADVGRFTYLPERAPGSRPEAAGGTEAATDQAPSPRGPTGERPTGEGTVPSVPAVLLAAGGAGEQLLRHLLRPGTTRLPTSGPIRWVAPNLGAHGFYRSRLLGELAEGFRAVLAERPSAERLSALADAWAVTTAGLAPLSEAWATLVALAHDPDPDIWSLGHGVLEALARIADRSEAELVRHEADRLAAPLLEQLGLEDRQDEEPARRRLRGELVRLLGLVAEDAELRRFARDRVDAALAGRRPLEGELAGALVTVAATVGTASDYDAHLRAYETATTPQEEQRYLQSLARFPDPELARRTAELAVTAVRSQDGPFLLAGLLSSRDHARVAIDFVDAHWEEIVARFPSNTLARMLQGLRSHYDGDLATRASRLVEAHPIPGAALQSRQLLDRLEVQRRMAERWRGRLATQIRA
jgi:puromycin-sensitive aminopeptidase